MPVPVPTSWMLIATPLVWPLHVSFWVLTFVLHFLGIIHQEDSLEAAARYTNILAVTFLVGFFYSPLAFFFFFKQKTAYEIHR